MHLITIKIYWPHDIQLEIQFSSDNYYDSVSRWQLLYLHAIIYVLGTKEIKILFFVRQWVGGWCYLRKNKSIFCFKQSNILFEKDDSLSNRSVIILNGLKRYSKYSKIKEHSKHSKTYWCSVCFLCVITVFF